MLQSVGPKPLIEPATLKAESEWVRAGKRVFEEWDVPAFRVRDPKVLADVRRPDSFARSRVRARPDGTLPDLRWIPTPDGLALGLSNCASCHTRLMNDGTLLHGAPKTKTPVPGTIRIALGASSQESRRRSRDHVWRHSCKWVPRKCMPVQDDDPIGDRPVSTGVRTECFPGNGSPFPTKIPDLIGIRDRKYIDHTATHQHRGPGDIMRYAALVTYSDASDFGPYRLLNDAQRRVAARAPDELLYAMTQYLYSLRPPPNPNLSDPRIPIGQQIFDRAGCASCHTPPLYTNNKLTLAEGFTPPAEHARFLASRMSRSGRIPDLH